MRSGAVGHEHDINRQIGPPRERNQSAAAERFVVRMRRQDQQTLQRLTTLGRFQPQLVRRVERRRSGWVSMGWSDPRADRSGVELSRTWAPMASSV